MTQQPAKDVQIPEDAWQNPAVFEVNRLPSRSSLWPHPTAASAAAHPGFSPGSPWLKKLSGDWNYYWAPDPGSKPAGFHETGFDDSRWKTIPVPGCVELYGYGTPLYVNSTYPFKVDPPRVMGEPPKDWTAFAERNPVSSYRRWVEIPGPNLAVRVRIRTPHDLPLVLEVLHPAIATAQFLRLFGPEPHHGFQGFERHLREGEVVPGARSKSHGTRRPLFPAGRILRRAFPRRVREEWRQNHFGKQMFQHTPG